MFQLAQVKTDGLLGIFRRKGLGDSEILMSKIAVLPRLGHS